MQSATSMSGWTEELLSRLSPKERQEAEQLMENQFGRQGFKDFITENFPHEPPPDHIAPIIELFERAQHERLRVCISLPPRHGKTVTILRGIAWWLKNTPADTCAYYSYSSQQAWSKSDIARRWAQQVDVKMGDANRSSEWRTAEGGGLIAGGLRAGLTGQGVSGLFVIDDPFKGREEADSPVIRDKVWNNFAEGAFTRLEGASIIVLHTRWHADDLIGRLTKMDEPWEFIRLPGISEGDGDPLGRPLGDALWPARFPLPELAAIKKIIFARAFAALYQGSPSAAEGNIIKREWIKYYDTLPEGLTDYLTSWDLTFKGKDDRKSKKGSYVVGQTWARKGADMYMVDQYRGRPDFPGTIRAFLEVTGKYPQALKKLVEDAAAGPMLQSSLREKIQGIILVPTRGQSKEERLHAVSPMFEAGNVWLPRWCEEIVEELVSFPNAVNDDMVDSLSMALNNYRQASIGDIDLAMDFGLKTENWRY